MRRVLLSLLLHASFLLNAASGIIAGFDVGTGFAKVAIAVPGRPIEIALNGLSKRKSPSIVSFAGNVRTFGAEAESQSVKRSTEVFLAGPLTLLRGDAAFDDALFGHRVRVNDTTGRREYFIQRTDNWLQGEEILAHYLDFAREQANSAAGSSDISVDAALVIPVGSDMRTRQAIRAAAEIAGIHPLLLVRGPAAAALHSLRDYPAVDYAGKKLLVDIGAGGISACVAAVDIVGKRRTMSVSSCVWSSDLSGSVMDQQLFELAVTRMEKTIGITRKQVSQRNLLRLLREAQRVKLVLSANKRGDLFVENIHDGRDFRTSISREEFEEVLQSPLTAIQPLIHATLASSNTSASSFDGVEVIGSAWRTPAVLKGLETAVAPLEVGQHINGDEGAAMGAALAAANVSNAFRLQNLKFTDAAEYHYGVRYRPLNADAEDAPWTTRTIVRANSRMASSKSVVLDLQPSPCVDVALELWEFDPRGEQKLLTTYNVTDIAFHCQGKYAKHGTPQITAYFTNSLLGIVSLDRVEALWNETRVVTTTTATSSESSSQGAAGDATSNATVDASVVNGDSASIPSTVGPSAEIMEEIVQHSIRCSVKSTEVALPLPMTAAEISQARGRLREYVAADLKVHQLLRKQNELESFIYSNRGSLSESAVLAVTQEEEREHLLTLYNEAEAWLDEEGSGALLTDVVSKLDILTKAAAPMKHRLSEVQARESLVTDLTKLQAFFSERLDRNRLDKFDFPEEKVEKLRADQQAFQLKVSGLLEEQAKLPLYEPPAFETSKVYEEIAGLRRRLQIVQSSFKAKKAADKPAAESSESESSQASDADSGVSPPTTEEQKLSPPPLVSDDAAANADLANANAAPTNNPKSEESEPTPARRRKEFSKASRPLDDEL